MTHLTVTDARAVPPHNNPINRWENHTTANFEEFLVRDAYVPVQPVAKPVVRMAAPSSTNSVIATMHTGSTRRSRNSSVVPSLSLSTETFSTESLRTSNAFVGGYDPYTLDAAGPELRDPNGRRVTVHQCLFHFLGCVRSFHDYGDWCTHNSVHFRGRSLPTSLLCPWRCQEAPATMTWEQGMSHVADHQRQGDQLDANCVKDMELFRHLHRVDVINTRQWQELMQHGRCDVIQTEYLENHNPRRDYRRARPMMSSGH